MESKGYFRRRSKNQSGFSRILVACCEVRQNTQEISIANYPTLKDVKNINCVWTLYDESKVIENAPYNPFTGEQVLSAEDAVLIHEKGVFIEDYIHDWNIKGDKLYIYSRVIGKDKPITLLVELNS